MLTARAFCVHFTGGKKKMSPRSVKPSASRRVTFRFTGESGDVVTLHGSFNNWENEYRQFKESKGTPGEFTCVCVLKPGRYEYKFQVNGKWILDDLNPNVTANPFGSLNNCLEI